MAKKLKLLLIEDDVTYREQLILLLKKIHDFEIIAYNSVESAIGLVEKINPDYCIIDHMLTGVDGTSIIPLIKAINQKAVIIVLSGQDKVSVVGDAIRKGAKYYIEKDSKAFHKVKSYIEQELKTRKSILGNFKELFSK